MEYKVTPRQIHVKFLKQIFDEPPRDDFEFPGDTQRSPNLDRGWVYVFCESTAFNRFYWIAEMFIDTKGGDEVGYYPVDLPANLERDIRLPSQQSCEFITLNYAQIVGDYLWPLKYHFYFSRIQLPWRRLPQFSGVSDSKAESIFDSHIEIESSAAFESWCQGRIVPYLFIIDFEAEQQWYTLQTHKGDRISGRVLLNHHERADDQTIKFQLWDAVEAAFQCSQAMAHYRDKIVRFTGNDEQWVDSQHKKNRLKYLIGRVICEAVHNADPDQAEAYKELVRYDECEAFVKSQLAKECGLQDQFDFWGAVAEMNFEQGLWGAIEDFHAFAEVFAAATAGEIDQLKRFYELKEDFSQMSPADKRDFVLDQAEEVVAVALSHAAENVRMRDLLKKIGSIFDKDIPKNEKDWSPLSGVCFGYKRKFTLATTQWMQSLAYVYVRYFNDPKYYLPKGLKGLTMFQYVVEKKMGELVKYGWEKELLTGKIQFFCAGKIDHRFKFKYTHYSVKLGDAVKDKLGNPLPLGHAIEALFNLVNFLNAQKALYDAKDAPTMVKSLFSAIGATSSLMATTIRGFDKIPKLQAGMKGIVESCFNNPRAYELFVKKGVPVLGLVTGAMDALVNTYGAYVAGQKNDVASKWGYGIAAAGGVVSAVGAFMVLKGVTITAIGAAASATGVGAPPGLLVGVAGLVLSGVGLLVVAICGDTDLETWMKHCCWGIEYGNASFEDNWTAGNLSDWTGPDGLERQLVAMNNLRYRIKGTLTTRKADDISASSQGHAPPAAFGLDIELRPTEMYENSILQIELLSLPDTDPSSEPKVMLSPGWSESAGVEPRLSAKSGIVQRDIQGIDLAVDSKGRVTEIRVKTLTPWHTKAVSLRCLLDLYGNEEVLFPADYKGQSKQQIAQCIIEVSPLFDTDFALCQSYS